MIPTFLQPQRVPSEEPSRVISADTGHDWVRRYWSQLNIQTCGILHVLYALSLIFFFRIYALKFLKETIFATSTIDVNQI